MIKQILSIAALSLLAVAASAQNDSAGYRRTIHLGLCYPISSNGLQAPDCSNGFSAHALVGVSQSEKAFCAAGLTAVILSDAHGLVATGFSNHIKGSVTGVAAAGFLSTVGQEMHGLQAAGFASLAQRVEGVQSAGFIAAAQQSSHVQAAGFVTVAQKSDVQIAGYANVADTSRYLQTSGFINTAKDANVQIAGFINVAKKVSGIQIAGFINIADTSDYSLALINIVGNGEKAIGVTVDETATKLLTFRSGGRVLYGIIGAGYNPRTEIELWALEGGIGANLLRGRQLRLNAESTVTTLTDFDDGLFFRTSLRMLASYKMGSLELFAGPSINFTHTDKPNWKPLTDHHIWSETRNGNFYAFSPGFLAGLQVHI